MAEKKDKYKFTIQFSATDPFHLQAAEILNAQGRRKASFLTNAILHYLNCTETPNTMQMQPASIDVKVIEAVVNRLLNERKKQPTDSSSSQQPLNSEMKPKRKSDNIHFDDAVDLLGEEGMAVIAESLAAFKHD